MIQKLQQATQILDQYQNNASRRNGNMNQVNDEMRHISNQINSLTQGNSGNQTNQTNTNTEKIREELAHFRQRIESVQGSIDEMRDQQAQQYRQAVGPEKDQFEQLSSSVQEQSNQTAFQELQAYKQLDRVHDLLSEISAELMDYSAEIEQRTLTRNKKPISETTDYKPDRDPAPHHLSP